MKYIIWTFVFMLYLLMAIGLLLLVYSLFSGINTSEINPMTGKEIKIVETEPFIYIYGFIGMFLTLGGGYFAADYVSKAWSGDNPDEPDRRKDRIKWCIFTAVFAVMFVLFRLHDTLMPQIFPNAANLYFSVKIWILRINLHEFIKFFILPFDVREPVNLLSLRGIMFMALTLSLTYLFTNKIHKKIDISAAATVSPSEDKE